jgi:site-specific recombinase XerD
MKPTNGRSKGRPSPKRQPQRIPEVLTESEQSRLLAQFNDESSSSIRGRAIIRVFLDTGLRAAELINLRLRDLDLATGRLWVRQGKGRKDRGLWFNGQTREALEAWFAIKPSSSSKLEPSTAPVFTSLDGRKPLCGRVLRRWVEKLGKQAGIEKRVHLHLLRHCFACRLLRKTKNLFMVSKALGHASVATTQIYLHLVDSELESAMKGLGEGGPH